MHKSYDIFRQQIDGKFVWVAETGGFARARQRVVQDPGAAYCFFLIVNALTGKKTIILPPDDPSVRASSV